MAKGAKARRLAPQPLLWLTPLRAPYALALLRRGRREARAKKAAAASAKVRSTKTKAKAEK